MSLLDDSHLSLWLTLFGQNIAMGFVVVAIFAALWAALESRWQRFERLIVGGLFGCAGIVSMLSPVRISEGIILDMRNVFALVGSLFGGPLGALVASGMIGSYRLYLGGAGSVSGVGSVVTSGLIGALVANRFGRRVRDFGVLHLAVVGLADALATVAWTRFYFAIKGLPPIPVDAEVAVLMIYPSATGLLGIAMSMTHFRTWRLSHRRLTDILETASDLVWEIDSIGRFTYVSTRYSEMLGFSLKEILGRSGESMGGRWVDEATGNAYTSAVADRKPFSDLHYLPPTRDGTRKILTIAGRPAFDELDRFLGYRGTATDITERERLRSLVESISGQVGNVVGEDFLKRLVDSVAQVLDAEAAYVGRFDLAAGTGQQLFVSTKGRILSNQAFSYEGLPSAIAASGQALIVPSGVLERYPRFAEIARVKIEAYAATPLTSAKGEVLGVLSVMDRRPFDAPEYVEAVLNLFAGRAAAELERIIREEEAELSRRRMAEIMAALNIARSAVILYGTNRRIAYANEVAIDLLGLPSDPNLTTGKLLKDFQPDSTILGSDGLMRTTIDVAGYWHGTLPWTRSANGRHIFLDTRIHRLPDGGDVLVATDATERLRLEEEDRRHRKREAQAGKVEALGNLAGGIAHDFNNLLGAVLGFGQFLLQDLTPGTEQHKFAERIVGASERGRSLVRQILAFSRRSVIEQTDVRVREIISEAYDMLRATLPSTTQIKLQNSVADAMLFMDKGQLLQVLVNLCVNASDALDEKPGTVTVSVSSPDRNRADLLRLPMADGKPAPADIETWSDADGTGHILAGGIPRGDCICIGVSDTGSGMPQAMLGKILEPFVTTKEQGKGTGLGLAVVHRIVIDNGGALVVTTREGAGTCIEIVLPLSTSEVRAEVGKSTDATATVSVTTEGTATILVVDDDAGYLAMVETALRRVGHRVESTNDARKAIEWIRSSEKKWDVLVTDQTMPHIRGSDLVRAIKANNSTTICIICTGFSSGFSEKQGADAGADGILLKPYSVGDLAALVARLLTSKNRIVVADGLTE